MTSVTSADGTLPAGSVSSGAAEKRLLELLATVPEDLAAAAAELAADAGELVARPLTVLCRRSDRWTVRAGPACALDVDAFPDDAVVRRGAVALVDPHGPLPAEARPILEVAGTWLALAAERDHAAARARDAGAETVAVTEVVERLLSVHDVDQLLLSIADRTLQLLDADICGVLLREGDEVCMRSCVGHRVVDTARLRMRRGQGVAGLVFQTGEPARVDRYVEDESISRDFVGLAEREETLSALAVPMTLPGEFLGVLEVWRRRPSVFTDEDVRRMVTLADFATIALRSAREHDEQQHTLAQLGAAHDALQRQVTVLRRTAELQRLLVGAVLEGGGLPAVARCVAEHVDTGVGIYDITGDRVVSCGGADLPERLPAVSGNRRYGPPVGEHGRVQTIYADGSPAGQVCLLGGGTSSTELVDAVIGQVAMACSLAVTRERTADRVRAEALDEVLWDLLVGPVEHRIAARGRAQQLGVTLGTRPRVLAGQLENLSEMISVQGWDTSRTDRVRREVVRAVRAPDGAGLSLCGLRGDTVVALITDVTPSAVRALVQDLITTIRDQQPGLKMAWGVSRSYSDPLELPHAYTEAKTALSASVRLGGQGAFLYEELGMVRLLLGSGEDPDLQTFITDVTGPLVDYDRDNDGALVRTLRAYFDADCSQRIAAERLFVHHKTMKYRLELIRQLTGLDLRRHDDRVRADLALRLRQLNEGQPDPD